MHLHLSDCASLLNQGFAAHCGKNQLVIWQVFIKILFLDKIELLPQCGKVVCPRHVLQLYGKIKTSR